MFNPTALIYSAHDRCEYLHRNWIIERALQSHNNKTIFHLSMSMGEWEQQKYGWDNFRWYYDRFREWGLEASPFFWTEDMKKEDVNFLFHSLAESEVVVLGGGNTSLGLYRYKELGRRFYGDEGVFIRALHERQKQGKLTVGFSAGASQLGQYLIECMEYEIPDIYGFGLAGNIMVTLHHEWGREGVLIRAAQHFSDCMIFGLPNDSGIAVDQGFLPSGNIWQVMEFIVDSSWDAPNDQFHIKTRQGLNIKHYYCDGREWGFNSGDRIVRIWSPDNRFQQAYMILGGNIVDYWSQESANFENIDHILSSY